MDEREQCAHCLGVARGYARIENGARLCHSDEISCYRMVTVYHHDMPCDGQCWTAPEIAEAMNRAKGMAVALRGLVE